MILRKVHCLSQGDDDNIQSLYEPLTLYIYQGIVREG